MGFGSFGVVGWKVRWPSSAQLKSPQHNGNKAQHNKISKTQWKQDETQLNWHKNRNKQHREI